MTKPPQHFLEFKKRYPDVVRAYEVMGDACHAAGPLNERTRALVKFALAIGSRQEGGAHAQIRKAVTRGIGRDELEHVAILAMQTIGFPPAMAAMSWIEDIFGSAKRKAKKKRRQ
jgi:alkylhydroperoxidase/carboxymuconolactone decarboxylase family protein YurZ